MSGPNPGPIRCPRGQWTQVIFTSFLARKYRVEIGSASTQWRRYSSGPPFYWSGSFTGSDTFTFWPDASISLQLNPSTDVMASVTPVG